MVKAESVVFLFHLEAVEQLEHRWAWQVAYLPFQGFNQVWYESQRYLTRNYSSLG